jgi:glycosyltransferase involved in cell wall biosynthesis
MADQVKVSVIIIFLNAERFIQEAIDSVFAQNYETWELLLIDDGSIDGSTKLALEYAIQFPLKVYYLEHPGHRNLGMSASRNLGIRHANGRYVAFLDADDIWLPRKLEEQVAILESYPEAKMVYGIDQYWYSWSGKSEQDQLDFSPELGLQSNRLVAAPELLPLFLRGKIAIPCPTNILVRRSTFEQVGAFEDEFNGLYEDQVFYAKVLLQKAIFVSDKCWTKYRQHGKASTTVSQAAGEEQVARRFYLNWLAGYFEEQGISDRELWIALQKELWRIRHHHYPLKSHWIGRADYIVGWWKKWLLGFEERILPKTLSSWLWYRG